MNAPCRERTTCRLCGCSALELAFKLPATPPANALRTGVEGAPPMYYPLEVRVCLDCSHSQLGHVVDPQLLFGKYTYMSGVSKAFSAHLKQLAESIVQRCAGLDLSRQPDQPLHIIEVGSNDGTLLKHFEELGHKACGIDPAINLVGVTRDRGLKAVHGPYNPGTHLAAERELGGYCDVLVANNVLAHIDDLEGVFKTAAKAHVRHVVFEVQYLVDLLESGSFDMVYHEHLDYHALTPLMRALPKWSYFVHHVEHVDTHGGSLRVWARHIPPGGQLLREDDELLALEKREHNLGMWLPAGRPGWVEQWSQLQTKVDIKKREVQRLFHPTDGSYSAMKKVIYGAPAKLTTFMAGLSLAPESFAYVVDDAPSKVGLFTPDGALRIEPSTVLKDAAYAPDVVLVAAWNLFDDILARLRAVNFKGYVVRCFPEMRVVALD